MSDNEQGIMRQAIEKEMALNQINSVLWNKALTLSKGDDAKRRECYIELRLLAMQETVKAHVLKEIKNEFARKNAKPSDFLSAKDLFKPK
jgi:hypothetical protein